MTIRIRLFAHMADAAKTSQLTMNIPDDSRLSAIRTLLQHHSPAIPWPAGTLLAINQEYADPNHPLHENDEVAIIPPVSGG